MCKLICALSHLHQVHEASRGAFRAWIAAEDYLAWLLFRSHSAQCTQGTAPQL